MHVDNLTYGKLKIRSAHVSQFIDEQVRNLRSKGEKVVIDLRFLVSTLYESTNL